jgi:HK97 family phage prohead protease
MTFAAEARFTALDLKSIADDGTFDGYASLFETEDLGRDVIAPGAFRETLSTRGVAGVRMLFQHKPDEPIGTWQELTEDRRGLYVRGRLASGVARAREVLALMRAGAIDGLSIGFRAVRSRRDRSRGVRRIEKIDLWEISIVTFPMLPGARIRTAATHPALAARLARTAALLRT